MKTLTLDEFHQVLKDQKVATREHLAMICPMCGTVQSAHDLIAAGAGANFDEVEKYLGFSCVGRWLSEQDGFPEKDGQPCNWTLGGLFQTHKLEVITPDGKHHPRFEPASPEQAQAHQAVNMAPSNSQQTLGDQTATVSANTDEAKTKTQRLLKSFAGVQRKPEHFNHGNEGPCLREFGFAPSVASKLIRWGESEELVCHFETNDGRAVKRYSWQAEFLIDAVNSHLEMFTDQAQKDLPAQLISWVQAQGEKA